ncbi:3-isopropylmalate dehydratase [Synchytrium microbalum]|uniref:Aconitate hydratase, mitochondrial n=1 Tax=Synchytrium microbalum TaxID=1806994 RepID=A0A507BSM8_9FUNG|nr:3-isopropylmalate dehydratase [Synchytrium microbalum]TPX30438.1 3-isopropylmalate dehydratase [Synchytrium microbalum]
MSDFQNLNETISTFITYQTKARRIHSRALATHATSLYPKSPIIPPYEKLLANLSWINKNLNRPLTLAEKIVYSHMINPESLTPVRGETYLKLSPDRAAMQDASAQMAILQFMNAGMKTTAVPTTVHCDHLIEAHQGGDKDVASSMITNKEIFDFLRDASEKYGIGFWKPGSGIIHQIVLENYAAPGGLMLGTDSHTPNAGGLGMIAIGVGGADAVDAMANIPWELKAPKILGVRLTGKLNGWASPKDVILKLAGLLTVQGGTNHIVEYFGPGVDSLSCTGMGTICNMGAEVGATTSVFPYTAAMKRYLNATRREQVAQAADHALAAGFLKADANAHYDQVVEIKLDELEPHINGPFTPDAATPISKFKDLVKSKGWKDEVKVSLIGSCTNSSYEDMSRAASIAKQAAANGMKVKSEFLITPGSEQIRATIERDGQTDVLTSVGGQVLANACGPCIGQWKRTDMQKDEENAILTSFNRNFRSRNDGKSKTMNFLASPEIVTAMAFAGKLSFNPATDSVAGFKFAPPSGADLPPSGFLTGRDVYGAPVASPHPNPDITITVSPSSSRLELLQPFASWDGSEMEDLRVPVKVVGKCTTDHISAAGKWLKYKGHLGNISANTLIGAVNEFAGGKVGVAVNELTKKEDSIPNVGEAYKAANVPWLIVADSNYGEGSAREHAALQPRHLGCRVIVSRSFARIHETNLKKQGILPVTFKNLADYDKITPNCRVSTLNLGAAAKSSTPQEITLRIQPASGPAFDVPVQHTMSADQWSWFTAGSALNAIASKAL